ncbi:uncharacterized protein LOC121975167 isoform X1 [Zingiber officinale]|uniref:uncharacterized protein LOC121975167 isoform X1 n=1 Tax=Zingiber officinale TaxID=94328 RepID=UPI001C4C47D8|nr:uncharacterized protein LOC121975167 isoform X1 [Zingiber officinale]
MMPGLAISLLLLATCAMSQMMSVSSWCPRQSETKFVQKTNKFWEFEEQRNTWVEISLPYDLISCVDDNCSKVASIVDMDQKQSGLASQDEPEDHDAALPLRRRISLTRMSEASVWVTGQSGSIFERFWNGVKWVIAPHELPGPTARAISVFIVNQTILALSEAGQLYQLQVNENSQPIWIEFMFASLESGRTEEELSSNVQIKSGVVSHDGERLYLSTVTGTLLEISEFHPLRWEDHGRPQGGDNSAIADTGALRPGIVFTISSSGNLYEFDKGSKPSWKKHIWSDPSVNQTSLETTGGCALHGLAGAHSSSLFLLTKEGLLVERRLHKRKWKWEVHGAPKGHHLSAFTNVQRSELNEKSYSLFVTTTTGCVFEYQLSSHPGGGSNWHRIEGTWENHAHPNNAKIARGVPGIETQSGRIIFALDDGRLGELHLPGHGGEASGPTQLSSLRRRTSHKYEWSLLDSPETEGWNAEYCTDERGPFNCMLGTKAVISNFKLRKVEEHQHYIPLSKHKASRIESSNFLTSSIDKNFRMRLMYPDKSFFLITDTGLTFEYLYTDRDWIWLRHEHIEAIRGAVGSYNGSLFLVDANGNLLIRERTTNELSWINCTAMRKGRQVVTGAPWDVTIGRAHKATIEDSLFFVSKKGRLMQFMVSLRKFQWKDCHSPPDTKIAFIVDQEIFRKNIIFVVGHNGGLYQYNRITELWHKHYQSPHLVLSGAPGTAIRPSALALAGSIFMISEAGGLVEYNWDSLGGWEWVEHGTPYRDVLLVGAPGPCFDGTQLFLIGSDGQVYRRHSDQQTWKWTCHGYPYHEHSASEEDRRSKVDANCAIDDQNNLHHSHMHNRNCNEKVAPVRPMPFSEDSVIFELQDGRLAELRRSLRTELATEEGWEWVRIIGTPTSSCLRDGYWTTMAS